MWPTPREKAAGPIAHFGGGVRRTESGPEPTGTGRADLHKHLACGGRGRGSPTNSPPIFRWTPMAMRELSRSEEISHAQYWLEAAVTGGSRPDLDFGGERAGSWPPLFRRTWNTRTCRRAWRSIRRWWRRCTWKSRAAEALRLPELPRRAAVIFDMAEIEPGQHTFTIDGGDVRLPRGVQLVSAIPAPG